MILMYKYIDKLIEDEISEGLLAGASLCVWRHGEKQYRKDYGIRDLSLHDPMPHNAVFRLYSATKPITAAAAMILVERGQLDLLDPVSKYLEGFKNQTVYENGAKVPVKREVTVKDLLNMTSGLVYPGEDPINDPAGEEMKLVFDREIELIKNGHGHSTVDFCNEIGRVPLAFQPDTKWRYGTGADIVGAVIESAAKMPFRQFLKDELFEPLGMQDTDFYVPQEKRNRLVTMTQFDESSHGLIAYKGSNLAIFDLPENPAFSSGGAGLFSTVDDYGKFANMLLNNGIYNNTRILGKNNVQFLRTNHLTSEQLKCIEWEQLKGYGYGNFMRVMLDNSIAASNGNVGEYGWDGWAGVYFAIDPQEDMVIEYFISRIDYEPHAMRRRMRAIIYAD